MTLRKRDGRCDVEAIQKVLYGQAPLQQLTPEEKLELKIKTRMEASYTNTGFRDWLFNAAALVADLREIVEPEVEGFRLLIEAIQDAARTLNDDAWERFCSAPFIRIHRQDHDVHTQLFSRTEPQWKQTMTMPKLGKNCVFFFIGTERPTEVLLKLFTRLGWYGVVIAPTLQTGFEECVSSYELDPGSHHHDEEFNLLTKKGMGKVPKPDSFPLVYVNLVFNMDLIEEDSEEDDELAPEVAAKLSAFYADKAFRDSVREARRPPWATTAQSQGPSPTAAGADTRDKKPDLGPAANTYGRVGVTRTTFVKRRLRAIRNCIVVGLQRLGDKGTMVICWPGLPYHPVLMYVVYYLRSLFLRVHLIVQENTILTFEMYILCTTFSKEASTEAAMGSSASVLKSFLDCAYRKNGVDDVLLWTLTDKLLFTECRFGAGGKSLQKSYDDMWTNYARKLQSLTLEMNKDPSAQLNVLDKKKTKKKKDEEPPPPPPVEQAKPKAKAKTAPTPKAKPKAAPKPAPEPKPKPKPKAKAASKPPPERQPSKAAEDPPAEVEEKLPPVRPPSTRTNGKAPPAEWPVKFESTRKKKNALVLSRSLPSLACSFGAAPGAEAKGVNPTLLGEKWPFIKYGFRCAEDAALFS
eukprot:TRINITY_DN33355_c0_g1_i1.p1 TRINITY_DN33355_c0_g1~~TRINITY_DN33355_c0_g1_i1.p1  ORF type:complete len:635 (+),score=139.91 TRINITY_DN33355_c0_g1_i1:119-2023(+)